MTQKKTCIIFLINLKRDNDKEQNKTPNGIDKTQVTTKSRQVIPKP